MIHRPCEACGLSRFRRQIVRGRGCIPCDILFIGEAPGKSEDLRGEAFVGPAGKVLGYLIEDAGLADASYYILNCCACRPCDSRSSPNREPTASEVLACMPRVHEEILRADPDKIILLGQIAARFYGKEYPTALYLIHPSFLLRSGGRASPMYSSTLRALIEYTTKKEEVS